MSRSVQLPVSVVGCKSHQGFARAARHGIFRFRMPNKRTVLSMIVRLGIALLGFGMSSDPSHAQRYPDRPIKIILPFTPGSPNDVIARVVSPYLSTRLRQPVVVENRPGGGTSIGAKAVIAAEPDGYTLLFSNSPTHFIAPLANPGLAYDPIKDFVAVATVGRSPMLLVIAPSVPARSVQEFIAYAKSNPGKLNSGFGQGTLPQLVGELFKVETGTDFASIPYRGGAQAVTDLMGGRIQINIGTPSTLIPLVRRGQLRALAITGAQRSPDLPDVPTMIESGLPGVTAVNYYGILGPAGMPQDAIDRLNNEVNESLKSPELKASMAKIGFEPMGGSPGDFAKLFASELQKWAPIVRATGFKMD